MHYIKKIFSATTGYWIHKISTLPVGADLFIDIHKRIKYGPLNIIFDVGANIGQTWEMFHNNEPEAKIYCFEPVSGPFRSLKERTKKDQNCTLGNFAFGEAVGQKSIKVFEEFSTYNSLKDELMNRESNAKTQTITIDTLDNYCFLNNIKKIDCLKIDTEGYEMNVLKGAEKMLNDGLVSFIFAEAGFLKKNQRNTNFGELSEWLSKKNYYFFGFYQLSAHAWKSGDYFGNALFVYKHIYNP